ncbi:MAG: ABC transporter substrate-binding protein, partial [Betaproteobacteria bacterium]
MMISFRTLRRLTLLIGTAALAATAGPPVLASDLIIGRAAEQSSIDPLFSRTGNNESTSEDIFDRLVENDANNQLHPALAISWKAVNPITWEIKLREGVKFHDGGDFSAEDVVFSLERSRNVPNSPASFAGATAGIVEITAPGKLTVQIKTGRPLPQLIEQISFVFILSKKAATGFSTADLNAGKGVIGTGPYKFVAWKPGQSITLKKNAGYWGKKADFENVTLKFIPKDAGRVAALLAGDVDLIDQVPPTNAAQLKADPKIQLFSIGSTRLIYLALDSDRDQSPFVTDLAGKALAKNPLKDTRVRRALSLMINRKVIVDRLLEGSGEPAGQMVPQGLGGYDASLVAPAQDLVAAKKLLAEAGYPQGFGLTLHSSSDRFA